MAQGSHPAVELRHGFKHGQHVLNRCLGLDIMNGIENKAPVFRENGQSFPHLVFHFFRRTERKNLLCVYAAPKNQLVSILFLQKLRLHSGSGALDRIQNIHTGIHKIIQKPYNGTACMVENFPFRVSMDPVIHLFEIRFVEFPEHIRRNEFAPLCAEIGATDEDGVNPFSHRLFNM